MLSVAKSHSKKYIHSGEPSYYKQKLIGTHEKRNKRMNCNSRNKSMTNSNLEENSFLL